MSKINLLPWREELRKQKLQEFVQMVALFAIIAGGIVGAFHYYHVQLNEYHQSRNKYIEDAILKLDEEIAEIQQLEEEKQRLLDRMRAIEQLQGNRPLIVRFFDELITSLPEGVSVNSIAQNGQNITIVGEAQSYARVASFMTNLESSERLTNPVLDIIQARDAAGLRISGFTLRFDQVIPKASDEEGEI